jgi:hypothetical protein
MSRKDRAKFNEIVSAHIAEGLHTAHGMTVAEYTAICRKAWDECPTTPGFTTKILIDPLRPVEAMLGKNPEEYTHWRVGDEIELQRKPATEITCVAVGSVKADFTAEPHEIFQLPEGEPETPEIRRYMLAVFDVLGFSALLERVGLREVEALYERLIAEVVTKDSMRAYSFVRLNRAEVASVLGRVPMGHAHFSDTIVLWVPLVQHFIAPFMARCADLVCEALQMGVPLRGALSVGQAVLHRRTSTFVGSPIVEAAKLEQAQNWVGACLGPSMIAADVSREFDPNLVLPYGVPYKKRGADLSTGLALDWPRRYLDRFGVSPVGALRTLDTSPSHHIYYHNAILFAEYSAGPLFRSDSFHGPNLGNLIASVIEARQSGATLGRREKLMLRDMARSGDVGESVAQFLRIAAEGGELPAMPQDLPPRLKHHLNGLAEATKGEAKTVQLVPCLVEIVMARFVGKPVSQAALDVLAELDETIGDGPATARFLRALIEGERPSIPRSARADLRSMLRQASAWIDRREVPFGLFESVANDCCRVATEPDQQLTSDTELALFAMESTSEKWASIAIFLREIAQRKSASIPPSLSEPLRSDLQRVMLTAQLAGVQQPRVLDIVAIGIGDPATGLNLWEMVQALRALREHRLAMPIGLENAISEFEAAAPERKVIADRLRAIPEGEEPAPLSPSKLPMAVHVALLQVEALAARGPIPIAPEVAGHAAIRARFSDGKIGDCMLLSLFALARAGEESAMVAEYLWSISRGGPAGPAPLVQELELARTVEEVRCLAEPEVGGIRMLMSRTKR